MKYFSFKITFEENKAIYRTLAKKHHPDITGKDEVFKALVNEWEFYKLAIEKGVKPEERTAYDKIFKDADFININNVEEFYFKNKPLVDELVVRIFKGKKNKKMDEDLIKFGFTIGKQFLDLFK